MAFALVLTTVFGHGGAVPTLYRHLKYMVMFNKYLAKEQAMLSSTATLEQEFFKMLSQLSPSQKRQLLDFALFLSSRRRIKKSSKKPSLDDFSGTIAIPAEGTAEKKAAAPQNRCSINSIFNLAPDCKDTDLSINHDNYLAEISPDEDAC